MAAPADDVARGRGGQEEERREEEGGGGRREEGVGTKGASMQSRWVWVIETRIREEGDVPVWIMWREVDRRRMVGEIRGDRAAKICTPKNHDRTTYFRRFVYVGLF